MPKTQYVLPHERGWAVKPNKTSRATEVHTYKSYAIERAVHLAQSHEAHVAICDADGKLQVRFDPRADEVCFLAYV